MGRTVVIAGAALLLSCAPWWPARFAPYEGARSQAVACVHSAAQDARLSLGQKWERVQYADDRFWRGRYRYPGTHLSSPTYLATYDQLTVDALSNGTLRIQASAWHLHANWAKGYVQEPKPPGPAADRFAQWIVERCGR